jgi:hypothetical protein
VPIIFAAFENQIEEPVRLEEVVDVDDVRVPQPPQALGFAEPLGPNLPERPLARPENLERIGLIERTEALEDGAERPAADVLAHQVGPPPG